MSQLTVRSTLSAALLSLLAITPWATAQTDPATWFPSNTALFVACPDISKAQANIEKLPSYKAMMDPSMKSTWEQLETVLEPLNEMANEFGF
ncbi:MAG: hypothetical protein HC886_20765, partial [Leptolyngbyaceae cyanobacterium SM1_1_3]|nr:hypothetical protein [Leptolyngbyaceae cyanobacterium SM1_1_3]